MKAGKKTLKEGFYTCTHPNGLEGNYLYLYGTLYICSNQVAVLYGKEKEKIVDAILSKGKFLGNKELRIYTSFKNLVTKKGGMVEARFTYEIDKERERVL